MKIPRTTRTTVRLAALLVVLAPAAASASTHIPVTVGDDTLFTSMNHADFSTDSDPDNGSSPLPSASAISATSAGATATASITATDDQAGIATASVAVKYDFYLPGAKTWDQVKDIPVKVVVRLSYTVDATYTETTGSANAALAIRPLVTAPGWLVRKGYEEGGTGADTAKDRVVTFFSTPEKLGDTLTFEAYAQAHSTAGNGPNKASVTLTVGSVAFIFLTPCDETENGVYVAKMCAAHCQNRYWRWRFWFTNYNVGGTAGNGEHQGIGVYGHQWGYDTRFTAAQGNVQRPWKGNDKFLQKLLDPALDDIKTHAYCGFETLTNRPIHNHGRTLANKVSSADNEYANEVPMEEKATVKLGPLTPEQVMDPNNATLAKVDATRECMKTVKDGFCDSMCGNCSYVLPASGIGTIDTDNVITGQTTAFSLPEPANVNYVGGPGQRSTWPGTFYNSSYADVFTHCHAGAPDAPDQAVSTKFSWLTATGRVITGRYGHNSNTDAEAAFQQFSACVADPVAAQKTAAIDADVCGVCGTQRAGGATPVQWPCMDHDNMAESKWASEDGSHNVDDTTLGAQHAVKGRMPVPMCRSNNLPVNGM